MSITTNDLAKLCGVSRTTVIRALNNTGRISDSTKQKILQTAKEHGYKPDLLARSLARGRTNTIGVIVLDSNNRYFSQMISAVSSIAEENGFGVSISLHTNDQQKEIEQLKRMAAYKVDGIILSSINEGEEYKKFLDDFGIPVVSVDNRIAKDIPFVGISQRKSMKAATAKVLAAGYKKIFFVCPPIKGNSNENIYVHRKRMEGFRQAIEECDKHVEVKYLLDWGYLEQIEALKITKDMAFVCVADEIALDIMMLLRHRGLTAGTDFGLHGFDAIDTLKYITPELDTVDNNVELVAKEAMKLLIEMINTNSVDKRKRIIVPFNLVEGTTIKKTF